MLLLIHLVITLKVIHSFIFLMICCFTCSDHYCFGWKCFVFIDDDDDDGFLFLVE